MSAIDFLLQSQNADGGWGYRISGMSFVEPTATVMLALDESPARRRARDLLLSTQRPDGGWGIAVIDLESGWMTAWAVRALAGMPDARDAMMRGANWLIDNAGLKVTDSNDRAAIQRKLKIEATLRGWSWQKGDASWVHPTALTILALIDASQRNHPRIQEGLQYLLDRTVPNGGWNVGNPWMLDKQIPATIQDTAIVLLALRTLGQTATELPVASAVRFLREAVVPAQTPAELAWGICALRDWGIESKDLLMRLNALQKSNGSWNDNPFLTAIAVIASKT